MEINHTKSVFSSPQASTISSTKMQESLHIPSEEGDGVDKIGIKKREWKF